VIGIIPATQEDTEEVEGRLRRETQNGGHRQEKRGGMAGKRPDEKNERVRKGKNPENQSLQTSRWIERGGGTGGHGYTPEN